MHFEPNGLSYEELKSLRTMAEFLENIPVPSDLQSDDGIEYRDL
jgi:hypothetical protein